MCRILGGANDYSVQRRTVTSRDRLSQLEKNFRQFIAPLLDERDAEDYHFVWEFQNFIHSRKLKVLTAEHHNMKKWKEMLLSR